MLTTVLLIAVTCGVSMTAFNNRVLLERLLFWPPAIARGEYQRFVTHGFVHADGAHLLFNMVTLFFFGRAIEPFFALYVGHLGFVLFYLAAIVAAMVPSYVAQRHNQDYRSLGASGAVSAVLFVYILLAPWSILYVFVIPVPAIVFAAAYVGYSFYAARQGMDHINHSAHLWGGAFGVVFALCMEPRLWNNFMQKLLAPIAGN